MVPDYKDEWPLHMRWPIWLLFLGWWLTGQFGVSGGEADQEPVISVSPTGIVPLGGNVNIRCSCGIRSRVSWHLTKHDSEHGTEAQKKEYQPCEVVFSISNDLSNAGIYSCRYCHGQQHCSDFSSQVCINLTDPSLPKPSIKMKLRGKDASGLNVTITCQGTENGLTFALYKSREQIAFQTAKPEKNTTMFSVFMVRPEDARNYRCRYHRKGNEFAWSEPSDPEELKVEGESPNSAYDGAVIQWAGIAAGLLLILLLLLVALILHRKRRKGSFVKEKSQPVRKPSEPGGGEDPEEVSYAVLNHKSLQAKQRLSPGTASESCVYASVVKD